MLQFDDPQLLWIGAISIPLVLVGLAWFRAMILTRRLSAVLARTGLLVLIAMALAGARRFSESRVLANIAVIDVSDSVKTFGSTNGSAVEQARSFLQISGKPREVDDLLGIVAFDRNALAIATPSRADVLKRPIESTGLSGTDIEAGLRLAGAMIPPDATGRITLFSDGNQTRGDALAGADSLASTGPDIQRGPIAIDVVSFDYRQQPEVVVESLDAPPRAASESTVTLRVVTRSTTRTSGTLELLVEGEPFDINGADLPGTGRRIQLEPGRNIQLIQLPLSRGLVHRFEAIFEPDAVENGFEGDLVLSNNRASGFTLTPSKGSVLVVDGVSDGSMTGAGATLARVLEQSGISVQSISPRAFPTSMLDLQPFDLIILENVPAEALDQSQQAMLVTHVRDMGAGLVMIGGPESFGAGGWNGSELAEILPVRLDLPDQIIVPEAAIVFVLDNSGSMGASVMGSMHSQQEIANEAAAMAVQSLDKTDLVGVISFNEGYRVVQPLLPNDHPERTASRIRSIGSGGGTTLGPALREAARQLDRADAKLKQVIVLTDGRSTDDELLESQAESMARQGIRVTTIGVGDAADTETLSAMAAAGGGSFYSVINPNLLPRIFLKAVRIVRSPLVREQEEPVVIADTRSPFLMGLSQFPPIEGLVLTRDRTEPGVTTALRTETGEPILAHWIVGLGQIIAFTSDAHKWTSKWLDSPVYRSFWVQLVRSASRVQEDSASELSAVLTGGVLQVTLDALDDSGRALDLLDVPISIFGPGGDPVETRLLQVGPGQYQVSVPIQDPGAYIVIAKPMQGATRLAPLLAGATAGTGRELARLKPDRDLLTAIAQRTGGRVLDLNRPEPGTLFDRSNLIAHKSSSPLWPMLVAWAILVYLFDVGTRRVAWDRFMSKQFGSSLLENMRVATQSRQAQSISEILASRRGHQPAEAEMYLGKQDAVRVATEARKARRQRFGNGPETSQRPVEPTGQDGSEVQDEESGLLAAKRRARKRFEGDRDG